MVRPPFEVGLWVDDERGAPDDDWTHEVASSYEATSVLEAVRDDWDVYRLVAVNLDYRLRDTDTTLPVIRWMARHRIWPELLTIQTGDPFGRVSLHRIARDFAPSSMRIEHYSD